MLVRLNPWDRACVATIDPQRVKSIHEEAGPPMSPAEQLRSDVQWIAQMGQKAPPVRWLVVCTNDGQSWSVALPVREPVEELRTYYGDPIAWDATRPNGGEVLRTLGGASPAADAPKLSEPNGAAIPPTTVPATAEAAVSLCSSHR